LDFEQFPAELVDKDNLSLTYANMLTKVGSTVRRVLEIDCQKLSLPTEALARNVLKLESQEKALNELNENLIEIVNQMKKHVEELMAESLKIDWKNSELAACVSLKKTAPSLLPPTPAIIGNTIKPDDYCGLDIASKLALRTPGTPQQMGKLGHTTKDVFKTALDVTPLSTGQVSRRIIHRGTPGPSPLLKLPKTEDCQVKSFITEDKSELQDTKDSLGVFSPVLCSTKSRDSSVEVQNQSLGSPVPTVSVDVNQTQSKIEMYKKVLKTVNGKDKEDGGKADDILSVWDKHRQSLSPAYRQTKLDFNSLSQSSTTPMKLSPLLGYTTPNKSYTEMDSKLVTRLDQLINFSDDSLDCSLGKMDLDLLSPHCP